MLEFLHLMMKWYSGSMHITKLRFVVCFRFRMETSFVVYPNHFTFCLRSS